MAETDHVVAIVGVSCRLPGDIASADGLWAALEQGRDLIGQVPAERFAATEVLSPGEPRPGRTYTVAGGFLGDVSGLDAEFFGVSPKEARALDPQQRLLMECALEAFDDAGIDPAGLAGSDTAVVMGVSSHEYGDLRLRQVRESNPYGMSGAAKCNTANRLSYLFDLHGPSHAVDTACSSALFAVHQACEALRSGRSRLALAGGVQVLLSPGSWVGLSQARLLSPTGRCRPFSAAADGYVRSEGAGVVVLKPLAAALRDGDRVYAVVLASGVNADGRTSGLPLPSADAQEALLRQVHAAAGVEPGEVAYVEAHGTGTQVGDPVECEALGRALGRRRGGVPLPVGSVKSNLGHLEAASAVPGLLKALLVIGRRRIPATVHCTPLNDTIDFAGLGLEPVAAARPVDGSGRVVVGVSSFGFGGANAHAVLASPPGEQQHAPQKPLPDGPLGGRQPLLVSARSAQALAGAARDWAAFLRDGAQEYGTFHDVAFTAFRRRARYEHRLVVLAADAAEAAGALEASAGSEGGPGARWAVGRAVQHGRVAFVFDGNGSQWPGMGAELLEADAVFRAEVTAVDGELRPLLGWSVLEEMGKPGGEERWGRTEVAQPMLFALQAGLVAALAARGVVPAAVAGHSVGEVAAAYCAGRLDRAAACRVIAARGAAQAPMAGQGRMAAVGLGPADAGRLLAEPRYRNRLLIAGVNSERDVTVAGQAAELAELGEELTSQDVFFRDLGLDYAFHSPAMDAVQVPLERALAGLESGPGRIPMVSTVTGGPLDGAALDAGYWWRNVREPVRFAEALAALTGGAGCDVLVEVGPRPVLAGYLRRGAERAAVVRTMTREAAGPDAVDSALCQVLAVGGRIEENRFFPQRGRVVSLPRYPWQRERYWHGHHTWWRTAVVDETDEAPHPLLGPRQCADRPSWQQRLEPARAPWLRDHVVGTTVVMPAAAFVDMALAAAQQVFDGPAELTGLTIGRALALEPDDPGMDVLLHTAMTEDGALTVAAGNGIGSVWAEHARCRARRLLRERPPRVSPDALRSRPTTAFTGEEHYRTMARAGLFYGPAFRSLTRLLAGEDEVLAQYSAAVDMGREHVAHPAVLDTAVQTAMPLVRGVAETEAPYLPVRFEVVRCWGPLPAAGYFHARCASRSVLEVVWDLTITGEDGEVALELLGCRARRFDAGRPAGPAVLTEVLRAAPLPGLPARPSPLPSPAAVVEACREELAGLVRHWHDSCPYPVARGRILELMAHATLAAVREFLPGTASFTLDDLMIAGLSPRRLRLLRTLLDLAVEQGVLGACPDSRSWRPLVDPCPERVFTEVLGDVPAEAVALRAYGVVARRLAEVLRGEGGPSAVLFAEPESLAAQLSEGASVLRFHHRIVRALVRGLVAGWPQERPLRVLEVGAGAGALTAVLLPELPPERTHYTVTDLDPALLPPARSRFADRDFVEFRQFDLDADPAGQGLTPGSYDLVVASDALHTARDLAAALRRVAGLLADGGQLLALESHNLHLFSPVFGVDDSYWASANTTLRPDGPLLPRQAWPPLLHECGFTGTVQVGDDREPARGDVSVLLAARQPRQAGPEPAAEGEGPARRIVVGLDEAGSVAASTVAAALRSNAPDRPVRTLTAADGPVPWGDVLSAEPDGCDVVLIVADGRAAAGATTERAVGHLAVLRDLAAACAKAVPPTVWLVTVTSAECGGDCPPVSAGAGAAAWGAARSLAQEHPALTVRRVALAGTGSSPEQLGVAAARLAEELRTRPEDDEVVLTDAGRFVSRIRPLPPERVLPSPGRESGHALSLAEAGLHYRLAWRPAPVPEPQDGQVVLKVAATALNYRDITTVTGLVPPMAAGLRPDVAPLGLECSGTVAAVGPGVTGLPVGTRVVAPVLGCFASHAVVSAAWAVPLPDSLSCTEAATLPVAFLTAWHCLHRLARLTEGETLLIHGGAGGVGLAALQLARTAGARVVATAGSPSKRDLLRLLGVAHVLDSRSLHFADQVLDLTGGRGVDVVLNSLAGEALTRSLGLLASGGRFVELGKRDFLAGRALPGEPFLRGIAFFSVDPTALLTAASPDPDWFSPLREALSSGAARPLPHRTYPAADIAEAFTQLRHSRHIGKVVVSQDEPPAVEPRPQRPPVTADGSYLITGGFGGLGAATARHLAAHGARHLTLVGRRGPDTPGAQALLDDLRAAGAEVLARPADATDPAALRSLLAEVDATGRRLAGVFHTAMVLDDAPLTELTDERLHAVLALKLTAGHLLDELTRDRDLDVFVVHSSVAALVGNVYQAPYVAANVALEALVRDRRRAGLPGLAVQWGVIADTGYVHRTGRLAELAAAGLQGMSTEEALSTLDRLLVRQDTAVALVGRVDWRRLGRVLPTLAAPRSAGLLPDQDEVDADERLRVALASARTPGEAQRVMLDALVGLLAQVLQTTPERIDRTRRLDQLGLDSLMGTEFASLISRRLGCRLPAMELVGLTGLPELGRRLLQRLGHAPQTAAGPAADGPGR